jgi:ATP-binding cassette subfamily B protein
LRRRPLLAVLDEPFRGLDRPARRRLLERARAHFQGATLLCVTHDVGETLGFDRVLVVEAGRVVEDGAPHILAANPGARFRALLDAEDAVRTGLWAGPRWERVRVADGRIAPEYEHEHEGEPSP